MVAGRRIGGTLVALLVLATCGRAADPDDIKKAIERGAGFLKFSLGAEPIVSPQHLTGKTALAALTLLECDLEPSDPVLQKATATVRQSAIEETQTYDISLAIMFFDRLGEKQDEPLIASLASRLLRSQNTVGGWSYTCSVDPADVQRLTAVLRGQKELPKPPGKEETPVPMPTQRPPFPGITQRPPQPGAPPVPIRPQIGGGPNMEGDNSNTQFATLALWIARRHQLKVDPALRWLDQRFRAMQNPDGGWPYVHHGNTTPTMTCSGLIGLAVAFGATNEAVPQNDPDHPRGPKESKSTKSVKSKQPKDPKSKQPRDPNRDPAIRAGLVALGTLLAGDYVNAPRSWGRGPPPNFAPGRQAAPAQGQPFPPGAAGRPDFIPVEDPTDYYLLWSVERVAMAYGMKTIGRKDWYDWGAKILLGKQRPNGSWKGAYEPKTDTCFALLFLARSNLVQDLTSSLKGKMQDPSEVKLHAGGIGGEELRNRDAQAGRADSEKPDTDTGAIPKLKLPGGRGKGGAGARAGSSARSSTRPRPGSEADRLSTELVNAAPDQKVALIDKLRESKGVVNTEALADAIPQLTGAARQKARDALVERLTRMTIQTVRDKLQAEDVEIRRAAALASAMKEEKSFVPDLIKLLDDAEQPVIRAAHAALKALTQQDFGPESEATRAERAEAVRRWKEWWSKNK